MGSQPTQHISNTEKEKYMEGLLAHRGANKLTRLDLAFIPAPDPTATFKPVPHSELLTFA